MYELNSQTRLQKYSFGQLYRATVKPMRFHKLQGYRAHRTFYINCISKQQHLITSIESIFFIYIFIDIQPGLNL